MRTVAATRYVTPLRLFVLLSVLTFFVGRLTVHIDEEGFRFEGREAVFATAQTIPEVEREREKLLAELSKAEKEAAKVPGVNASLVAARARIQAASSPAPKRERRWASPSARPSGPPKPITRRRSSPAATWGRGGREWRS